MSLNKKVIIFGTGQISQVLYYLINKDTPGLVGGFVVDKKYKNVETLFDLQVVDFEDIENFFSIDKFNLLIPIGYNKLNKTRTQKYLDAKKKGYSFSNYISPHALVNTNQIGENTIIFEYNNIQPFVKIGNNCIIWSGNHIGHHSIIEDNCFISSHVVISGSVVIKNNSFIGVNASIRDNIVIGKECIIGAGSVILRNVKDFSILSPRSTEVSKVKSNQL